MGGWVGASDKASTGRAEKARVGGVGDTENRRLKTFELYRQAKGRNPGRVKPVCMRSDNGHSGAWPRFSDFRVILIHLSRLDHGLDR